MKKLVSVILITIILFNALFINTVNAAISVDGLLGQGQNELDEDSLGQYMKEGTQTGGTNQVDVHNNKEVPIAQKSDREAMPTSDQVGWISKIIGAIISGIAHLINFALTKVVGEPNLPEDANYYDKVFTIERTVFGEYPLFDINFFEKYPEDKNQELSTAMNLLRESIAKWYGVTRTIAIIASLCVLIYIAIRMAISTVTADKVKYRKMFEYWLVSFVMIFLIHYLILIMITLSNFLVELLFEVKNATTSAVVSGSEITAYGIEPYLIKTLMPFYSSGMAKAVLFAILVWFQFKFFKIYIKRFLVVAFLISIAPLVTITYAINRAGDNEAAAFKNMIKELSSCIFIQPIHALLFLIFLVSAVEIAKMSILLAIMFLWGISKGEMILKNIFGIGDSVAIKSLKGK